MEVKDCTIRDHNEHNLLKYLSTQMIESVKSIAKNEGYVDYEIKSKSLSTNNNNYLGILYTIDVKGKAEHGDKETYLFVKNKPEDFELKVLSMDDIYKRESFVYKDLFKIFQELQEEANIPCEERYKTIKYFEESNNEAIIMENIAIKGFKTYYRMEVVSLEYAKLAIQALAKFHALSFVIKEKRPEYFNTKIKSIKSPVIFEADWKAYTDRLKHLVIEFVDEEFKDKVIKLCDSYVTKYDDYVNDESIAVCLIHGDYRPSNILAKIENDEVLEVIPVDYQLVYYGCPVFDFQYFIYLCTDRDFRKNHLLDLKDLYYETLSSFMNMFDLDVNSFYTRNEFEKIYKHKLDIGLLFSLYYTMFMFIPDDAVPDMKNLSFQIDNRFQERIRGILKDYEEWGYI